MWGGGMWGKLKSGVKSAASLTKTAATGVYNNLTSLPTTVTCSNPNCKVGLAVPEAVWVWTCNAGHTNVNYKRECDDPNCEAKRELPPAPEIRCGECQSVTVVPTSNASKYARNTTVATKKAAADATEYTKKTYSKLKSKPATVKCYTKECRETLCVPPQLWDWECPDGHPNGGDDSVCTLCQAPPPKREAPTVVCPKCNATITVHFTAAQAGAVEAARTTQLAAEKAAQKTKEAYKHYTAAPEQFNCAHCNVKLGVPQPREWACTLAGCGVVNPANTTHCSQCKQKNTPRVLCGVCQKPTDIPTTNLSNAMRSTTLSAKSTYKTAQQSAAFVSEHKEDIKAAGKFASDNSELTKSAINLASASSQNPR